MLKTIKDKLNEMEEGVIKIMKVGFKISFGVCIVATLILFTYICFNKNPNIYYSGIELFKAGLAFMAEFTICGLAIDKIKKQMI